MADVGLSSAAIVDEGSEITRRSLPLEEAAIHEDRWDQASVFHQILMSLRICVAQTQIQKPKH